MRLTIPTRSHHVIRPVRPPEGRAGRHTEPPPAAHRSHRRLRRHRRPGAPQDRPCPRAGRRDDCERDQGSDGARLCLLRLSPQLAWFAAPLPCKCSTSAKRGASPTLWGATRRPVCDSRDKHTRGAELLEKLSGAPADAPKAGYAAFAPVIEQYLNEHLFCDIFERDLLTWQERELAAVAILTALGEGAPADAAVALRHLPAPGAHGRPAPPDDGNRKRAEKRRRPPLCTRHADARQSELRGGRGVVARLCRRAGWFRLHGVAGVTFAPGCRNSWHSHEGGQLLLCTSGRGYYQETGKPIRLLLPGRCGEDSIIM